MNGLVSLVGRNGFGANFSTAAGAVHGGSAVGHVRTFCIVGHGAVGTRCLQVSDHGLAGQCAGGGCCSGVVGLSPKAPEDWAWAATEPRANKESGDSAEVLHDQNPVLQINIQMPAPALHFHGSCRFRPASMSGS